MKRVAAALLAAALLAGCGASHKTPVVVDGSNPTEAPAGERLPAVSLKGLDGEEPLAVGELMGTPTIINLWASYCGPCKTELPILAKAHTSYGDRVRIIGIDFADGDDNAARALARNAGVDYPLYVDPKSLVKNDLRVIGLPQTVFVDAQGTIVATERAAFGSSSELSAAIEKHLGVKP